MFDILKTYNKHYYLTHPWKIISEIKYNIKWAWQRIFRGWDDRVCWSIDGYLFKMMPQWLRQLKETKHGIPFCFFEEIGAKYDNHGGYSDEDMKNAEAHFNKILDQMIEGFESGYKVVQSDLQVYCDFKQWQIDTYGQELEWSLGDDDNPHSKAWDEFGVSQKSKDEIKLLRSKLDTALALFCEYHDTLWD